MSKKMNRGRKGHKKVSYLKLVTKDFKPIQKEEANVSLMSEIKENEHHSKAKAMNWIDRLASKYLSGKWRKKLAWFVGTIILLLHILLFTAEVLHANIIFHETAQGNRKEQQLELKLEQITELNEELSKQLEEQQHLISEIGQATSEQQKEMMKSQSEQIDELKKEIETIQQNIKQDQ